MNWWHHTFNIVEGCAKVSAGCVNCYAERMTQRWGEHKWVDGKPIWGANNPRKPMSEAYWRKPLSWNRKAAETGEPCRAFVGTLHDWAEDHPTVAEARARLWPLIRATPNLTWMLLTKRPENLSDYLPADWNAGWPNVWLGTTVENRATADRTLVLGCVPAQVRFLSCEPLLGPLKRLGLGYVRWVICGGESGYGCRPMDLDWARDLRDQCRAAGVAFWFKQRAGLYPGMDPVLDGETIQEVPA